MSASLRDLKVWQEAVALAAEVVRLARKASRREIEVVTDLLMTSAIAVASEIAEGTAFHDPHTQHRHYEGARQSLLRLETELAVARQAGLFDEDAVAGLSRRAMGVARLLGGSCTSSASAQSWRPANELDE